MKAYKVFDPDWKCKRFQYAIGQTYTLHGEPVLCEKGFHACKKLSDCFTYYEFNPKNKIAEVELDGIILGMESDRQCSSKITIIREITWSEALDLFIQGSSQAPSEFRC